MATIALPLDAASGSPTFSAQATRQAFSAFLGVAPSGRPLGASSGVRPGTPSSTVTVSGSTWSCAAHSGVLDLESSAVAGPYLYATDGTDTGSITAADATNPRIDVVYVQVKDNVQDSSGSESGLIGYIAGTPAATPVAPTMPAHSMALAQISVPKAGGGNPSVSWVAPMWNQAQSWSATRAFSQSIGSTTETQVVFGTSVINVGGAYSTTTGNATIVVPGWYDLFATVNLDQNTNNNGYLALKVNGSLVAVQTTQALAVSTTNPMRQITVKASAYLNAGDVVGVYVWHNAGAAISVNPANGPVSFAGVRVGS
ncbi:MAG TPA: hypothetical protein VFH56_12710 [Acidimicrobiales bacterium]|nr:hypothetical protein [Acidimicrobiales bacterium]